MGRAGLRTYGLLAVAVALSLFPLYWMFVVGSNDSSAISRVPPTVVPGPNFLRNASRVVHTVPFLRSLLNTAIVATAVTASVVFFSTLAGFAFARLQFRGRGVLFLLIVATMIVPVQLGIIPQFMIMVRLGWVDRLQAVIVPGLVTAFGVFWMRQYISSAVPQELLEAGRVDGCSTFRLFWSVVVPAARPGAAVLGLFTFMQTWNDFLWPLVVLRDPNRLTVQVALQGLNEAYFEDYGMVMAGTVLSVLPLLVIFVLLGRQIVGGIMEGALKG
ncbi:MAG TPA: carbohydrate ABC transporter permease [Actinomycetota bacterium]|nr:carbohydrate ABC transporter permease [Actinomycetota bacterium]